MKRIYFRNFVLTCLFIFSESIACDLESLEMPQADAVGRVRTLNQMGGMNTQFGEFEIFFIASLQPGQIVLDIGCAYGAVVKEAAQIVDEVWANDLEPRHLDILLAQLSQENYAPKIKCIPGDFTDLVNLPESYFDRILLSRVFHFFDGPKIKCSLEKVLKALKPGGDVHILVTSPYIKFAENFLSTYLARKEAGVEWPGYCDNIWEVNPAVQGLIPAQYHFLDVDVLADVVKMQGFDIVEATYMVTVSPFQSSQEAFKDKGYAVVIARKPS